jgi:DNA-binding Lrp family transcriptional regulator
MDALDQRLIAALKQNARISVAELASRLAVSRGTVSNRIRRLESDGTIAGYTLRLRAEADTAEVRAWVSIAVSGHQTRAVIKALLAEPDVDAVHDTNGRWDLLAEIRTADLAGLSRILERLRSLPAISTTETSIHLQTYRIG